jgi:putative PEP-CTERM system histidine kinase
MRFEYVPLQVSLLTASAVLSAMIGLFATLRRGHWLITLLFSSAFLVMSAFQAGTIGMLLADSGAASRQWATYLAGVSALASWVWLSLSVVLARTDPWDQVREAAAYLTLALVGCVLMFFAAGTRWVVSDVEGYGPGALVHLGVMGKIYLMYLVVVMVAVLMNFERMLRIAPATTHPWLRPMFLAFLVGILSELLVVSGGLLYSGVRVTWLAASAIPLFASGSVTALSLARRRLSDMSVPVARPVVYYSSVSLTLAGAFLLSMAVLSKLLPVLPPEWKHIVGLAFYLLAGGGGLLLTLSPAANRAVKRFIDRNFYANRYDYRREWERVSGAIVPAARPEDVCRQIEALVCAVFDAERAAIYLRDDRMRRAPGGPAPMRKVHGPSAMPAVIDAWNPLVVELDATRVPVRFDDLVHDLDLIPVAAENRPLLQAMNAAVCAPLCTGDQVIGLLWLAGKRSDEDYSHEDIEFLAAMARQLAAALWFARLAEQLAETRQLESLHRLSSFVLHDIKNHVSGLSLVVENARKHIGNPDFQRDALAVVERTVQSLRELMNQVAGMARPTEVQPTPVVVRELVDEAAAASGLAHGVAQPDGGVAVSGIRFRVECRGATSVRVDRQLIRRVLVNLLTNARESLPGPGDISILAEVEPANGDGTGVLSLEVRDSGRGMSEEFIRTALFRPFATTKPSGLGVGLAQCKSIVEAHGGTITVDSQPGAGTTFSVRLPAGLVPARSEGPA